MTKDEIISFAKTISNLDSKACGHVVQKLMLNRTLSKVVRGLDKLETDKEHKRLAQLALTRLGFDVS